MVQVVEVMHTRFLSGTQKAGSDRFYSCINIMWWCSGQEVFWELDSSGLLCSFHLLHSGSLKSQKNHSVLGQHLLPSFWK